MKQGDFVIFTGKKRRTFCNAFHYVCPGQLYEVDCVSEAEPAAYVWPLQELLVPGMGIRPPGPYNDTLCGNAVVMEGELGEFRRATKDDIRRCSKEALA